MKRQQGVEYCDKLFAYERHFKEKGYSCKQIKNGRLKKEKPVIEAFLSWLEKQKPIKGSKFATAVTYALNRKEHMMTYLEDGRCSLSNNLSEQKMKSYSPEDFAEISQRLEICITLFEDCERNYKKEILLRVVTNKAVQIFLLLFVALIILLIIAA